MGAPRIWNLEIGSYERRKLFSWVFLETRMRLKWVWRPYGQPFAPDCNGPLSESAAQKGNREGMWAQSFVESCPVQILKGRLGLEQVALEIDKVVILLGCGAVRPARQCRAAAGLGLIPVRAPGNPGLSLQRCGALEMRDEWLPVGMEEEIRKGEFPSWTEGTVPVARPWTCSPACLCDLMHHRVFLML